MAIFILPSEFLYHKDKWCLQCQLVLLTTWNINVIQWCRWKINRAGKEINMFKNKCITCWLVQISFTQGEVYSGLDRKTAEVKFNPRVIARGSISVSSPASCAQELKSLLLGCPLQFSKYLYIQISFVLPNKSWKQGVGCVIPTIQMGKLRLRRSHF